ncbi:MAG: thioesterase family protein [Deltaproteobacteria bacterium]|nr:thioesterase family protein [Deltaproteobacteria bacterium]MBN2670788.1 thioesterase family protein [Deltaproteobacteria bacterium]
MPKVKVQKLSTYPVQHTLTIRVSDLNYGAHLAYDRVLTLAHQARIELFSEWNVTEIDLGDQKTGLVVGDVAVNYLGEGFLNDKISIETAAIEVGSIAFRFSHRFSNIETGKEVALAEIGFVGFDYNRRMPGRLPPEFTEKLKQIAG